jgi:hypothetical protein
MTLSTIPPQALIMWIIALLVIAVTLLFVAAWAMGKDDMDRWH